MRPSRPPTRGAGGAELVARVCLAPWRFPGALRTRLWRAQAQHVPRDSAWLAFILLCRAVLMCMPLFFLPLLLRRTWQLGRWEPPPNPACGAAVGHTGAPKFATGHQYGKLWQLAVARILMEPRHNRAQSFIPSYCPRELHHHHDGTISARVSRPNVPQNTHLSKDPT